uniref:Malate dehydrogenase n=1 Tax=Romanomermis culicivorax TaxID=13658 RepID=A0A915KTG8_ROMCU
MADKEKQPVIAKEEVKRYMVDCMVKVGTDKSHAEQLADVLIAGDCRGHYSHGLNRLEVIPNGGLLPLGGTEETGGYKGYGLGMLVEIFCGIMGGAHWGPHVRKWLVTTSAADLV